MNKIFICLILITGIIFSCNPDHKSRVGSGGKIMAGTAQVDISPVEFPVIVNGYFNPRIVDSVKNPVYAKCIIIDNGNEKIAIAVVDNLFMPGDFLDEVKQKASEKTGIKPDKMMISATHTHTAPSVAACLGADADSAYIEFLRGKIVETIRLANDKLEPAQVGWTATSAPDHTFCRRWIVRPDKILLDAYGDPTVRANMHPGYQNPDFIGPSGPADKELSLLAIQSLEGRPIALLANYSMHFCGSSHVCSDYYGKFAEKFSKKTGATESNPGFVAIMSQGTSGDLHWNDYSLKEQPNSLDDYGDDMAEIAVAAYKEISYHKELPVKMLENTITLNRRFPDEARVKWAEEVMEDADVSKWPDKVDGYSWSVMLGKDHENELSVRQAFKELYARELMYVIQDQDREIKLQVIKIGDLAITAIPCEVYGITGLKIKGQSPVQSTFNIGLANGAEGYIPPPEQHLLGGYTTWLSRTTSLELDAEPKILEAVLSMLEEVSGEERRPMILPENQYDEQILHAGPLAYWPMNEMSGSVAHDISGNQMDASYEEGVVYSLDGPEMPETFPDKRKAIQFTGGRMISEIDQLNNTYSVECWFWNGLPADAREYAGFLFSDGGNVGLGISGNLEPGSTARLVLTGESMGGDIHAGTTSLELKEWNHVLLVRDGESIRVYLNGLPEIEVEDAAKSSGTSGKFIFGGRSDGRFGLEGRMCNVAVYDKVISMDDIHNEIVTRP